MLARRRIVSRLGTNGIVTTPPRGPGGQVPADAVLGNWTCSRGVRSRQPSHTRPPSSRGTWKSLVSVWPAAGSIALRRSPGSLRVPCPPRRATRTTLARARRTTGVSSAARAAPAGSRTGPRHVRPAVPQLDGRDMPQRRPCGPHAKSMWLLDLPICHRAETDNLRLTPQSCAARVAELAWECITGHPRARKDDLVAARH